MRKALFVRASELYDVSSGTRIAHTAHQATDADDLFSASVRRLVAEVLGATVRSWRQPAAGSVAETYLLALEGESAPSRVVCKLGGARPDG